MTCVQHVNEESRVVFRSLCICHLIGKEKAQELFQISSLLAFPLGDSVTGDLLKQRGVRSSQGQRQSYQK